jgi:hypothetical protein
LQSDPRDVDPGRCDAVPRVWLVLGEKRGDNAQIVNLARAVGWDYEERHVAMRPRWVEGKPRVRPTLDHVDRERSDALEPPWPDLVITAGRRLSSVALWIAEASEAAGRRTRLVLIGKPRRLASAFDLVVAARHYVVPPAPNVATHGLPLMQVDAGTLEAAAAHWRPRLAALPRPLTALMVGGPTGGLRFDLVTARDLFEKACASVAESGGSLYVTTSRRTPAEVTHMLREACRDHAQLYVYDPEAPASENPYHALLALADRFVVTTDSASMMVEVARLGRPLAIHPLESRIGPLERALATLGLLRPLSPRRDPQPGGGLRARLMLRLGWPIHSRDLSAIPRWLVEQGRACWLGDAWIDPEPFVDDEVERIAERIRALVRPAGHAAP